MLACINAIFTIKKEANKLSFDIDIEEMIL